MVVLRVVIIVEVDFVVVETCTLFGVWVDVLTTVLLQVVESIRPVFSGKVPVGIQYGHFVASETMYRAIETGQCNLLFFSALF